MFRKVKDWVKTHKTAFALIVTALFVLVHIPIAINHENWNDEAISYALSREINLTNIYEINDAEPHPLLWQLILAPFSKMGLPVDVMSFISLAFVALAVFLFIRFAPMNFFIKLVFLLSNSFFYFAPIISRDYSLIPLAICLVCIAYQKRHEKPFIYGLTIAFLTQTHFLMYGFAAALGFGFVIEEVFKKETIKDMLKKIFLFALPVLLSLASVVPIVINSYNNQAIISGKAYERTPEEYLDPFYPNVILNYFGADSETYEIATIVVFVIFAIVLLSKSVRAAIYFIVGEGFWFYVMGNIYKGYDVLSPKAALITMIIMASIWLASLEESKKNFMDLSEIVKLAKIYTKGKSYLVAGTLIALLTIPHAVAFAVDDMNKPFSNAKDIASAINEFEDGSLVIQADAASIIDTVTREHVTKNVIFYNYMLNKVEEPEDYLKYDNRIVGTYQEHANITNEELESLISAASEAYEHVYYFTASPHCSSLSKENVEILNKYERLAIFNEDTEYLDLSRASVSLYKIK